MTEWQCKMCGKRTRYADSSKPKNCACGGEKIKTAGKYKLRGKSKILVLSNGLEVLNNITGQVMFYSDVWWKTRI